MTTSQSVTVVTVLISLYGRVEKVEHHRGVVSHACRGTVPLRPLWEVHR